MYEVCIIGGGMSGMTAAITAAEKGKKVAIIDRNAKLGRKLYATGNGRCNITNEVISFRDNYSSSSDNYPELLHIIMGQEPIIEVNNFLNNIGIITKSNNGYIYPYSMQASSFVWALIDKINKLSIDIILKTEVKEINKEGEQFKIYTSSGMYESQKLIFACGGKSYKSLGATDIGYELLNNLGHKIINLRPALCGLVTASNNKDIAGVRSAAKVSLYVNGRKEKTQSGELQFTEFGLSGILIFNLSSCCGLALQKGKECTVTIDFAEGLDHESIKNILKNSTRTIHGAMNSILNDKLCLYILDKLNINSKLSANSLEEEQINKIASKIKNMEFCVKELCDYDNAQISAGGVCLDEINPYNMESKLVKGLYITGEVLDVDGECGGYNISFAICSGIKAGKSV